MKKILLFLVLTAGMIPGLGAQTCPSCGSGAADSLGDDTGPSLDISLGTLQFGLPAGDLSFSGSLPIAQLVAPASLQLNAPLSNLITVVTNADGSLRQVNAPQGLADIPVPATTNGYTINFYYPSQISGLVGNVYQLTGNPFVSWQITNANPSGAGQLQIAESMSGTLLKQWTYSYSTSAGAWTVQDLAGVAEAMTLTNLSSSTYQIINSVQYTNGSPAQIVAKTYQTFSWGSALVQIVSGAANAPEVTTYTYYDPAPYTGGNTLPVQTIINTDGSWQWYAGYDTNGNATNIYSSFGDITLAYATNNAGGGARQTFYTYDPVAAGVSGSGDAGTNNAVIPRLTINRIGGQEVSRSYSVFPSASMRLDIQCTTPGAAWNASGNLITTNLYYTSGPNQFALQSTLQPDGTATTYDYVTNSAGTSKTNITATGQADAGGHVVDGTSNRMVLNYSGYTASSTSWDVKSGLMISQNAYGGFDSFGRPTTTTNNLNNTIFYTQYACCGLDQTTDPDGMTTLYSYDAARRQVGYENIYGSTIITFNNTLDAAGRTLKSVRIGSDSSSITQNQSVYDTAGELIGQTNALNGVTTYTRTNDPATGGLIRITQNPDGGTITNYYYADGSLKKTIGTAVHGKAYSYGTGTDASSRACTFTTETNLDANGNLTSEWTKSFADIVGRTTEILYADGHYSQSFYNSQGQLWKQVDADGVVTLYQYNGRGEQAVAAVAMVNQSETSPDLSNDRITSTVSDVTTDHGTTVRRTSTYVFATPSSSTSNLVSVLATSADGLSSWQTKFRDTSVSVTNSSVTTPGTTRTAITYAPDNSQTRSTNSYGRLISVVRYDSSNNKIGGTTYGYDAHGRQGTMTDALNGTTTYAYNNADQVTSVTTPTPTGGSAETTTATYNNMMQATITTLPDNMGVTNVYLLTGELGQQSGSRTYPVGYSYDYAGRMKTLTNWSGYPSTGARVTTWTYSTNRGFLTSKTYADNTGSSYAYTYAGRLASRIWARSITTSYAYDSAGGLATVIYSDGITPGVTNNYDRLGRLGSVSSGGMTDTLAYNLASELLGETFAGGPLNGLSVTNQYDQYLRRTNLASLNGATTLGRAIYTYDAASRLATVSDGTNKAGYSYLANSPLVSQIRFTNNTILRMTTTNAYDALNRRTQISSATASNTFAFNYDYNAANQRTKNTLVDGSYWVYTYDSLGQVTGGNKFWADGTPVAGQQFDYTFDTIGNRTQTLTGGDQTGANLRTNNYYANSLNQITNRAVAPYADIKGVSIATNTVKVNGNTAYRKAEYFRYELSLSNSASALWSNIIVSATGQTSVTGSVYLAKSPEIFSYDADGNLTNDGRFTYTWDGENRLISMTNNTSVGPQYQLTFGYDFLGRRIQKLVVTNGVVLSTNNFLYDGWNLITETKPDNTRIRTYVWGSDLSGSMQGAGGIGGLLEVSYYTGSAITNCFPAFDGNGNVSGLINAADGTTAANYDYGPFGEPIRITGAMANNSPFFFSTKYYDSESGLYYYGYRYYNSGTGTWANRDPLQERGGYNIYAFVNNTPLIQGDLLGLALTELSSVNTVEGMSRKNFVGATKTFVKIGTFDYPRKGACGCWERNVYASFAPTLTVTYEQYRKTVTFKDDFSLTADVMEQVEQIQQSLLAMEEELRVVSFVPDLLTTIERGIQTRDDVFYVTSVSELTRALTDKNVVHWSMSKAYYKNGQSEKISNITCQPKRKMFDATQIKNITDGLTPDYSKSGIMPWDTEGIPIGNLPTVTLSDKLP